ncbi:MAG: ABC transporter ATP-binding protein [Armatimonadetes bacterium]|nr:ABC transporter ATP-binding protein [Armatimonadota bacterium]
MARAETPVSNGEVVIQTESLSKTYTTGLGDVFRLPGVSALVDLNMEVYRGEVFAMIGPNGSGKTTTLKLLMGLIFPSRGVCRVLGRNPRTDVSIKRRIGFMPDGPYFYGHLNGFELLDFYANLLGVDAAVRKRRIPELLDMVGMSNRARNRVRTYSKGMVQRIGLAHALLNDPDIVFLDEPTSGLDPIGARDIRDVVIRMKAEGKTVFLCSHFLTEIENLCNRVILLDRGRTLRYGALEELLSEPGKMRITASGLSDETKTQLEALGRVQRSAENRPSTDAIVNDGPELHQAIALIRESGGHLDAVAPMRRTLEDVFMEAVERTQADQPWNEPEPERAPTEEAETVAVEEGEV